MGFDFMNVMTMLTNTPAPGGNSGSNGKFDILKFLNNTGKYVEQIASVLMMLIGIILIIVSIVQIAKGLAGGGRGQVNWVSSIACLLVGGALLFGGWQLVAAVASSGADTLSELGGGQAISGNNTGYSGSDDAGSLFGQNKGN